MRRVLQTAPGVEGPWTDHQAERIHKHRAWVGSGMAIVRMNVEGLDPPIEDGIHLVRIKHEDGSFLPLVPLTADVTTTEVDHKPVVTFDGTKQEQI